jgi:hypothetical protein
MRLTSAVDRDHILSIDDVTALSRDVAAEYDSRLEVVSAASTVSIRCLSHRVHTCNLSTTDELTRAGLPATAITSRMSPAD